MKRRTLSRVLLVFVSLLLSLGTTVNTLAQELPDSPASPQSPDAAGLPDATFGGFGGDGRVDIPVMDTRAMAIQTDGKIVVIGEGSGTLYVRRYLANGEPDTNFGTNGQYNQPLGQGTPCNFDYSCGVALQTDGKIIIAADTDSVGSDKDFVVFRLTANGELDRAFGLAGLVYTDFSGEDDSANDVVIQPDGKIIVVGTSNDLTTLHLNSYIAVARYNSNGSLDTTFSGDGKLRTSVYTDLTGYSLNFGKALSLQPDGKILVVGSALDTPLFDHDFELAIVRYHPNGTLDTSFSGDGLRTIGFGGDEEGNAVAVQTDGKILSVGSTSEVDFGGDDVEFRHALVRLEPNSDLDTTFGGDGKRAINIDNDGGQNLESLVAVDLQPDGKIVAVGYSAEGRIVLMRLRYDGSLDTSFVGNGILDWYDGFGRDLVVQPDGKFLVLHNSGMIRFLQDGNFDQAGETTIDFANGNERAWAATVAPDGKIILAGEAVPWGSSRKHMALARFNPDGTLDTTFDGNGRATATFNGDDVANEVIVHPDGSILAAGQTRRSNYDFALYRFEADGAIDQAAMFNVDFGSGDDYASDVLYQPDGKIVLAGFAEWPGTNDPDRMVFALARLNPDHTLDTSFGSGGKVRTPVGVGPSARLRAALLQPDGKIVAVGYQIQEFVVVRYNPNGTLDAGFGNGGIVRVTGLSQSGGPPLDHPLDYANGVGLLRDGNIAVAGQGSNQFGLLILGPDGGHCTICGNLSNQDHYWLTFDMPAGSAAAYDMVVQPDGKIVMVGERTLQNPGLRIARLKPKTGATSVILEGYELDPTFGTGGKMVVPVMAGGDFGRAVALYGSRIIVAGHSSSFLDFNFTVAVLENDIEYYPPDPWVDAGEPVLYLPLIIR